MAKFLDNASKAFRLIDLDDNGGMTAEELQESIAEAGNGNFWDLRC